MTSIRSFGVDPNIALYHFLSTRNSYLVNICLHAIHMQNRSKVKLGQVEQCSKSFVMLKEVMPGHYGSKLSLKNDNM